jgi:chemotaxis methyl-accepting protein methylase
MEQTKNVIPDQVYRTGMYFKAIAACSNREAYSLAIAFKEALESTGKHRNLTLQFLLRI